MSQFESPFQVIANLEVKIEQLEARVEELRNALDDCHKARSVLRDAMAVTPVKWDEDRIDRIGQNGNDGLAYQEK